MLSVMWQVGSCTDLLNMCPTTWLHFIDRYRINSTYIYIHVIICVYIYIFICHFLYTRIYKHTCMRMQKPCEVNMFSFVGAIRTS